MKYGFQLFLSDIYATTYACTFSHHVLITHYVPLALLKMAPIQLVNTILKEKQWMELKEK